MTHKEVSVLLIEDDEIDVMGIKRAFTKSKIANPIIVAEDGIAGLKALREGKVPRPYLILLDLNMPRMNGLEFLEEIRKDENFRDSIIFVMTTSNAEQDKWKAYQHNIAGYILKENVGTGFINAISLLDHYWRIVEFPEAGGK